MLRYLDGDKKNFEKELNSILNRRKVQNSKKSSLVKKIVFDVKKNKDTALLKYEKKFSNLKKIKLSNLKFSEKEIKNILKKLDKKTKKSIDLAFDRIYLFHKNQKIKNYTKTSCLIPQLQLRKSVSMFLVEQLVIPAQY